MSVLGRRMSQNKALHLMDAEKPGQQTWFTLCGRKIRASHALPLQKFDFGEECCTVCIRMQRSNNLLHQRLGAA